MYPRPRGKIEFTSSTRRTARAAITPEFQSSANGTALSLSSASLHIMKLGKCKVFIKCDGSNVREFNPVVHDGGRKVSCWIASEPGKVSVV